MAVLYKCSKNLSHNKASPFLFCEAIIDLLTGSKETTGRSETVSSTVHEIYQEVVINVVALQEFKRHAQYNSIQYDNKNNKHR